MAVKKEGITYEEIIKSISTKEYKPIYYLMGEESYYIDRISDYIANSVLSEDERGFNQVVLYGVDTDVRTIINSAKSFPMMGKYQVVIVKEAQHVRNIEELVYYAENPLFSTILVLCHKNGTLDRRKKLAGVIQKVGVLYESKKLKEHQLAPFIASYLKRKGVDIEASATMILANNIGADLNRMIGELDKLMIVLPKGERRITAEMIERNIGVSKDFNEFELINALTERDAFKANQIAKYFYSNPKGYPIQRTLSVLFNFYSNLMLAYYAPQKDSNGIAQWLEISPWQAKTNVVPAMSKYSGVKVMKILSEIRRTDAKSKGIDNVSMDSGALLQVLIFFILH